VIDFPGDNEVVIRNLAGVNASDIRWSVFVNTPTTHLLWRPRQQEAVAAAGANVLISAGDHVITAQLGGL